MLDTAAPIATSLPAGDTLLLILRLAFCNETEKKKQMVRFNYVREMRTGSSCAPSWKEGEESK